MYRILNGPHFLWNRTGSSVCFKVLLVIIIFEWYRSYYKQIILPRSHHMETLSISGGIMSAMASQITGVSVVCSTVCSINGNIKAPRHWPLGIHCWPVDSPHKGPVTQKIFPFPFLESRCWSYKTPWRSCNITVILWHFFFLFLMQSVLSFVNELLWWHFVFKNNLNVNSLVDSTHVHLHHPWQISWVFKNKEIYKNIWEEHHAVGKYHGYRVDIHYRATPAAGDFRDFHVTANQFSFWEYCMEVRDNITDTISCAWRTGVINRNLIIIFKVTRPICLDSHTTWMSLDAELTLASSSHEFVILWGVLYYQRLAKPCVSNYGIRK